MATKNSVSKTAPSKKEYKKDLAGKIESALPDLKTKLGDKEFQHRIKKAVKLLAQGFNNKKNDEVTKKSKVATQEPVKKAKAVKKIKAKKQAPASSAN